MLKSCGESNSDDIMAVPDKMHPYSKDRMAVLDQYVFLSQIQNSSDYLMGAKL